MTHDQSSLKQLLAQPIEGLSELELSEYGRAVVNKRLELDKVVKTLKSVETAIKLQASNSFMIGKDKIDLNYGSFTRSETHYMKLPETGWDPILRDLVAKVNAGGDPVETFDMVSLSLKAAHFKKMTPDEIPLGITRDTKVNIKFNPKKA